MSKFFEEVKRGSGRTTAIAEHCVDRLIDEGFVICYDHYETVQGTIELASKVKSSKRLITFLECISNDYVEYAVSMRRDTVNITSRVIKDVIILTINQEKINHEKEEE